MEQDFSIHAMFCDANGIVIDVEQDLMLQKTLYFWYTDSYTDSKFYDTEQDAMIAAITFLDLWVDYDLYADEYESHYVDNDLLEDDDLVEYEDEPYWEE